MSVYGLAQSATCSCIDLHHAEMHLLHLFGRMTLGGKIGLDGLVHDRDKCNDVAQRHMGVDRTPSTLFFFMLVWRNAISC